MFDPVAACLEPLDHRGNVDVQIGLFIVLHAGNPSCQFQLTSLRWPLSGLRHLLLDHLLRIRLT
ncbi:hypothetical protein, partial [Xanthomonas albilineans]|uniref:hypothetical protein n=1 Tax=Xanthomonas albilineans TaxID=29447 RepID=UPI001E35F495